MQTLLKKVSHASTLFPESNYYSFNSVVTADIASSVESEDPAEDPCSDDDPDPTGKCLITGNSPLQLSLRSYIILTVE